MAISHRNRRVISGSFDHSARIWNSVNGRLITKLQSHNEKVTHVAISRDGDLAATIENYQIVRIWDCQTGNILRQWASENDNFSALAFIPSASVLILGKDSGEILIHYLDGLEGSQLLKGHRQKITGISVSTDNRRLVSSSLDSTAKIWDLKNGTELLTLRGHNNGIHDIKLVSNDELIITAGSDHSSIIWETN